MRCAGGIDDLRVFRRRGVCVWAQESDAIAGNYHGDVRLGVGAVGLITVAWMKTRGFSFAAFATTLLAIITETTRELNFHSLRGWDKLLIATKAS